MIAHLGHLSLDCLFTWWTLGDILDIQWGNHVDILDTWTDTPGNVGHTNGNMVRFLDLSWDIILSVSLRHGFCFLKRRKPWGDCWTCESQTGLQCMKHMKGDMPNCDCESYSTTSLYLIVRLKKEPYI